VDQHRAGDAAATVARHGVAQCHVVGHDDDLDRNALGTRQLGGKTEIQAIAGIVLDHQHRAGQAGGSADAGQHGVDAGRSKDVAGDRRREQAGADIACMRRFVARTAARDHRNSTPLRQRQVGAYDDVEIGQQRQAGMEVADTLQHLAHHMARIVDQFLQECSPNQKWCHPK
jgi:hypothetical protein